MPICRKCPIQFECSPHIENSAICPLLKLLERDFLKKLENLIEDLH